MMSCRRWFPTLVPCASLLALTAVLAAAGCSSSDSTSTDPVIPQGDSGTESSVQPEGGQDTAPETQADTGKPDVPVTPEASTDSADAKSEGKDASQESGDASEEPSPEGGDTPDAMDGSDGQEGCSQTVEECNGKDDNCNGAADEGNPGGDQPCTIPGKLGECAKGNTKCTAGQIKCVATVPQSDELCDGLDNDCDGTVDNAPVDIGTACNTALLGVCAAGTTVCNAGSIECQQDTQSSAEVCNGLDDDCNGTVDNGFAGAGDPCTVTGATPGTPCAQGQTNCLGGSNGCTQIVFPSTELCDGVDNDCDGTVDNTDVVTGKPCTTSLQGICSAGKTACTGGTPSCTPDTQPGAVAETCNGKDDDCDGTPDDVANIKQECSTKYAGALNVLTWACTSGACQVFACSGAYMDCDGEPANGCEVNTANNVNQCGACGLACGTANGVASCVQGVCKIACNGGYANCDGVMTNGCEQPISNDVTNCGACGNHCDSSTGTPACINGACQITCNMGLGDCDNTPGNGCEANLLTDPGHCGSCIKACSQQGGVASCVSGQCQITCNAGYGNCDVTPENGCETNVMTDPLHCGACAKPCNAVNGVPNCVAGQCQILCSTGWGNCDGNAANGCEQSLNTPGNCGACGTTCVNPNGSNQCVGGACSPTCWTGWGDCDGKPANGCETSLKTLSDCGACAKACSYAHATTSCSTGTCSITSCASGWGNCDTVAANGCEVSLASSPTNCGTCGNTCSSTNGTAGCTGGACTITCNAGWGNCDNDASNGCEMDTALNPQNCGACGTVCTFTNASGICSNGTCALGSCNPGWGNCDNNAANGCEAQLNTSANCGYCGQSCVLANATTSCSSGTCAIASCASGYANCDGQGANGCEINTRTNPNNCGSCGNICTGSNGTPTCSAGACSIACNAGWGNCDNNPSNGCETPLTSNGNCGACGKTCTNAHGSTNCISSACVPSCTAGFGDCDGNPANGCEAGLTTLANCGACGVACNPANATGSCTTGTCAISSCSSGYANCDSNVANGCEASLTSLTTCGSCTNACTNPHGTTACNGSACVPGCASGYASCDSNPSNGCEVSTATDPAHCGSCTTVCSSNGGTATCTGGLCGITCNANSLNCNGLVSDGCEINKLTDVNNCGTCGNKCTNPNGSVSCVNGTCQLGCGAGFANCDGNAGNGCEANVLTDPNNCGGCGVKCVALNGTNTCTNGVCVPACTGGFGDCDGLPNNGCEANLSTSSSNCGACGTVCQAQNGTNACSGGVCSPVCSGGYGNCDGNNPNGCETTTSNNVNNCGTCGIVCQAVNGSNPCSSSNCSPSCNGGYGNCDGNNPNGCETSTQTNLNNCGTCGRVCSSANGTRSCSLGACSIVCNSGYGNCDGNAQSNGCETNTSTNVSHCGGCNQPCSSANGSPSCFGGVCSITCNANYGNCDGLASNGCEVNLLTNANNCGTCGKVCSSGCTNGSCSCTTTNVALTGTASRSSGGEEAYGYGPSNMNNNVSQVANCATFAWVDTGSTYGGGAWIEIDFPSAKKVSSIYMDTNPNGASCSQTGRTLAGGDLQYWNGSTWVTIATVLGKTDDWSLSFTEVTTTKMRMYNIYATGDNAYNAVIYEWQIFGCN